MRHTATLSASVLFILLAMLPAPTFAFKCADGQESHAATANEAVSGGTGKNGSTNAIIAGTTQVCSSDAKAGISEDAGAAKSYLSSIAKNLRNSQAPPTKERIDRLNDSFAICAAKFLKAYAEKNGPIYVVSAFRCGPNSPANITCDRTENARAGGAGASNHQLGIAADIYPADGNYAKVHNFARANPQFGVWFRLGMGDAPHMEPTNRSNPSCSGVASTPVKSGGGGGQQGGGGGQQSGGGGSEGGGGQQQGGGGGQQGGGFGGGGGDFGGGGGGGIPSGIQGFGGGASPYSSSQPGGGSFPGSSQQPYGGAVPASGSGVETAVGRAAGAVPASGAVPGEGEQPKTAVSDMLNENAGIGNASPISRIGEIAHPTTTPETNVVAYTGAIPSPTTLNASTREEVSSKQNANPPSYTGNIPQGSIFPALGPSPQQTFPPPLERSEENTPIATSYSSSQDTSFLLRTLEIIRQILLNILRIITPFGSVGNASSGNLE